MSIVTKGGDHGETSLYEGRIRKDNPIIEAYGTVDELNSFVGGLVEERIQNILFKMGAQLCGANKSVSQEDVEYVEGLIKEVEKKLPPLKKFILPSGQLHIARAVCRRAERRVVAIGVTGAAIVFLNRLSDYLFLLARKPNDKSVEY